jgi:hypothetical protein
MMDEVNEGRRAAALTENAVRAYEPPPVALPSYQPPTVALAAAETDGGDVSEEMDDPENFLGD